MHVERSPIDSSLLKYWMVSDANSLLKSNDFVMRKNHHDNDN